MNLNYTAFLILLWSHLFFSFLSISQEMNSKYLHLKFSFDQKVLDLKMDSLLKIPLDVFKILNKKVSLAHF